MTAETDVVALSDELVEVLFDSQPLGATMFGVPGYDSRLTDVRPEAEQAIKERAQALLERADAIDPATLTPVDRLTRAVVQQEARALIGEIDSALVEFTVTDLFIGPAASLLALLPMIPINDAASGRSYLDRLAAVPEYLAAVGDRHRAGVAAGRVPVARLVRAAVEHLDRYLADPAADPLGRKDSPDGLADFAERCEQLLAESVRPAFARYRGVLTDEVAPAARPDERAGVSWLPGGDALYASLTRHYTTTDRSPEELHQTGLDLIAELAQEYARLGESVFGTRKLPEVFERLRTDSELRWSTAEELLAAARDSVARAEAAAPAWFRRLPAKPCVVVEIPKSDAVGAAPAYYLRGTMDGSRPGTFMVNTHQITDRFRHTAQAIAFHEAVPGHHQQITIAQELSELPMLRRMAGVTAYAEGWGLYSERLADEMGLYSGDLDRLGMLTADSWRAGRLVVDTGLHAKGWSRAQAIDYLRENTPMALVEIESEIDRYIAFPGQALAYMVGRLEIQRIRARAEAALGERFDIRDFHDVLLGAGQLPLSVLDQHIAEWVDSLV